MQFKINRKGGLTCRGQVLRQIVSRVMKCGDQSPTFERIQSSCEILQFTQIHVYRTVDSQDKNYRDNVNTDCNVNTDPPHFSSHETLQKERETHR